MLLATLAVVLGVFSWWNRYNTAHRVTEFWGPELARVLVEQGEVEAIEIRPISESAILEPFSPLPDYEIQSRCDLSSARGMVHLRFALTSDSNYHWDAEVQEPGRWKWAFRFTDENRDLDLYVLFDEEFTTLGKLTATNSSVAVVSCEPMTETLRQYFFGSQAGQESFQQPKPSASKPTE